jgi:hypothetical protein
MTADAGRRLFVRARSLPSSSGRARSTAEYLNTVDREVLA